MLKMEVCFFFFLNTPNIPMAYFTLPDYSCPNLLNWLPLGSAVQWKPEQHIPLSILVYRRWGKLLRELHFSLAPSIDLVPNLQIVEVR